MNRCAVDGCGEAAWTHWRGFDLCKPCSEAAWMWATNTSTAWMWATNTSTVVEAADVVSKIAENLRTHGTRSGPEECNR